MIYIRLMLSMMQKFGIMVLQEDDVCYVPFNLTYHKSSYQIEPDVSEACYFYAMALLLGISVVVKQVHFDSIQGDIKFLKVLKQLGCSIHDTERGICVTGRKNRIYPGITIANKKN